MAYFMEHNNIYLRPIVLEDFTEQWRTWRNNPDITNLLFQGILPSTKENLEFEYNEIIKSQNDIVFAIAEKASDKHFGFVGLYNINWITRVAEHRSIFGLKEFWGKGLAKEMMELSVSYGFNRLNLNKIWAGINIENIPSIKMCERNGWTREGVMRQHQFRNGHYYDALIMSILKDEYLMARESWEEIKLELPKIPEVSTL